MTSLLDQQAIIEAYGRELAAMHESVADAHRQKRKAIADREIAERQVRDLDRELRAARTRTAALESQLRSLGQRP